MMIKPHKTSKKCSLSFLYSFLFGLIVYLSFRKYKNGDDPITPEENIRNCIQALVLSSLYSMIVINFHFNYSGDIYFDSFTEIWQKNKKEFIISYVIILAAMQVRHAGYFVGRYFGKVNAEQLLFFMYYRNDGEHEKEFVSRWVLQYGLPALINSILVFIGLIFVFPCKVVYDSIFTQEEREKKKFIITLRTVATVMFIGLFYSVINHIGLITFENFQYTDMYDKYYVDPSEVHVDFPEKKQNIIMIYLESIESTFASKKNGGIFEKSIIPELEEIAVDKKNTHFSDTDKMGGVGWYIYAHFTLASWLAMQAGIPLKPYRFKETLFFPAITTLGDIFSINDYKMYMTVPYGRNAHGASFIFQTHGNSTIFGIEDAKKEIDIPENFLYDNGNMMCDAAVYNFSKKAIPKIASEGKPFVYLFETLDTHIPRGKLCPLCRNDTNTQFNCVRKCASRQVGDFVNWFKEQPFYHNTTLFITGDHLAMGNDVSSTKEGAHAHRSVYNVLINPVINAPDGVKKHRLFSPFDWFPTILAAIGCKVHGERLGLGTNLYSGMKTLTEQNIKYPTEVLKHSRYYRRRIAGPGQPHVRFVGAWKPN